MSKRNYEIPPIVVLFLVFVGIIILYLIFKILFVISIFAVLLSLFIIIYGYGQNEKEILVLGVIAFVISIGVLLISHEGITFFESNPSGQNLINASDTFVNSSRSFIDLFI